MTLYELIYETVCGTIEDAYAIPGVENAFQEGGYCDGKYTEMSAAYDRLRERLGVTDEDPDVEIIINSLTAIQHHIARQMFFLGTHHRDLPNGAKQQ